MSNSCGNKQVAWEPRVVCLMMTNLESLDGEGKEG